MQNFWKPLCWGRTTKIITENVRNYQLSLPPFYFIYWLSPVVPHSKGWPDLDGTWWGYPFALSLFFKWRLDQEWPPVWVNTFSFTINPATSPGCLSPNIQGVVPIIILRSRPHSPYVRGQMLHEGRCFMYAVSGGHSVTISCNCKVNLVSKVRKYKYDYTMNIFCSIKNIRSRLLIMCVVVYSNNCTYLIGLLY